MNRFKMSFNNSGAVRVPHYNNLATNLSSLPAPVAPTKNVGLNAPMIDRVYKAKPGCSACGKKVA
jgi:hypothetical protein